MNEGELVREYEGLAIQLANDIATRYRLNRFKDDLIALGREGLLLAARRFDPDRGAEFSTYAWYVVRSRILDGCRAQGLVKRKRAARDLETERQFNALQESEVERHTASGNSLAAIAGDLDAMVQDAAAIVLLNDPDDQSELEAPASAAPDRTLERRTVSAYVRACLEKLPDKEQSLIVRSFYEGKSLSEIADEDGCSKSWASRQRRTALDMLEKMLNRDAVW